jgi:hypothetical protein
MLLAVLHARLVIHQLVIDGREVPVKFATVVAVARAESEQTDWEVVAECMAEVSSGLGRCRLDMVCITGATEDGALEFSDLSGEAVVVRFVDRTIVLRGDGPLDGLSIDQLQG